MSGPPGIDLVTWLLVAGLTQIYKEKVKWGKGKHKMQSKQNVKIRGEKEHQEV